MGREYGMGWGRMTRWASGPGGRGTATTPWAMPSQKQSRSRLVGMKDEDEADDGGRMFMYSRR